MKSQADDLSAVLWEIATLPQSQDARDLSKVVDGFFQTPYLDKLHNALCSVGQSDQQVEGESKFSEV